jgi:hypothetical protein
VLFARLRRLGPTVIQTFGKYVTVVKCSTDVNKWIAGAGRHYQRTIWLEEHIGTMGNEWDWFSDSNTFVFTRPEDAVAFKLKFDAL